jgi:hypothetical protein
LFLFGTALASAQEGHPLTGTWHGSWGPNAAQRTDVTLVIAWDGKNVTGIVNPGFDGAKLQNAALEPKGWMVHFEADAKDGRIVADGKIENVTNARRSITGTWAEGGRRGDFKLVRDN